MDDNERKIAVGYVLDLVRYYDYKDFKLLQNILDTLISLIEAIDDAGGYYGIILDQYIKKDSTFLDFIANVAAPNGVRFHCNKKDFREER